MVLFKRICSNEVVIIDGLTRSGKYYLGKLISGINDMEYFINSSEVERIIAVAQAGSLDRDDAHALLVNAVNEEIYNRSIGRNMNLRHNDSSSIMNSYESKIYLNRQNSLTEGNMALHAVVEKGRSSVFILHQSLRSIDIVKGAIPKSFIINIRRHPIDLAYSWLKKGWGHRFGVDPISFTPIYDYNGYAVPYFAIDWADEYLNSSEYDRVVKSIIHLTKEEDNIISSGEYDICCAYYDNLVMNPEQEILKISQFLDKSINNTELSGLIARETKDSDFYLQRNMKMEYIYEGVENNNEFDNLVKLSEKYEDCINNGINEQVNTITSVRLKIE